MSTLHCPATVILARHGEAEYESDSWDDRGGSLSHRGREQSAALADRLSGRRVAHVWVSDLARAVQTGEMVAASLGVSVTTRHDLREFSCGDFVGAPRSTDPFHHTFAQWLDGDLSARIPGAESGAEVVTRMRASLADIADLHPGETVLVVSHGGAMRISVPTVSRMDVPAQRIGNCATVEIEISAEDWVCRSWDAPA